MKNLKHNYKKNLSKTNLWKEERFVFLAAGTPEQVTPKTEIAETPKELTLSKEYEKYKDLFQ